MAVVDANIILRYILNDHEEYSLYAAEILENQSVILPIEAACEVVYVLQKVYGVERSVIKRHLGNLLDEGLITIDKSRVFLAALDCYSETSLDFVDTLLWAYFKVEQQEVYTFDNKLRKLIRRTKHNPE